MNATLITPEMLDENATYVGEKSLDGHEGDIEVCESIKKIVLKGKVSSKGSFKTKGTDTHVHVHEGEFVIHGDIAVSGDLSVKGGSVTGKKGVKVKGSVFAKRLESESDIHIQDTAWIEAGINAVGSVRILNRAHCPQGDIVAGKEVFVGQNLVCHNLVGEKGVFTGMAEGFARTGQYSLCKGVKGNIRGGKIVIYS